MCPVVNRLYVVIRWVLGYGKKDTHTYPQKERKTCALELTHRSTQVRCEHLPIDHTFFPPHCVWSNHPVAQVVIHDGAGLNSLEIHRSTILFFFSFEKLFFFFFLRKKCQHFVLFFISRYCHLCLQFILGVCTLFVVFGLNNSAANLSDLVVRCGRFGSSGSLEQVSNTNRNESFANILKPLAR